jgi:hypothetical protein
MGGTTVTRRRESPLTELLKQRTPLTDEQVGEAFREWRKGASTAQLSAVMGVPERTLSRVALTGYFRWPRLLLLAMRDLKPNGKWH